MRVLLITSEWPTDECPHQASFIVQQVGCLREAGVEVEVFPFRGRRNPINYLKAWRAMRRAYRLDAFDVIHAQFGQSGVLAWRAKVPLVVTFRGSDLHGIVRSDGRYTVAGLVLRRLSRQAARWATQVIVVSRHLADYLPPAIAPHIIPSGIDLELFRPTSKEEARAALGLPPDQALVLFAAHPDRAVKRYPLARTAVDTLRDEQEVELVVMAGVPHERVPAYMNACDVLLLTSRHEGSPNVIKEALACNMPVVSVDVGDARERIGAVEGCIVCPDDSPETIADALARVLRAGRRVRGRETVLHLNKHLVAQQVIEVYGAAIRERAVVRERAHARSH